METNSKYNDIISLIKNITEENEKSSEKLSAYSSCIPEELHKQYCVAIGALEAINIQLQTIAEEIANYELTDTAAKPLCSTCTSSASKHSHHSPQEKKRQMNRLSRIIGHLAYVKRMIDEDESCEDVLMQIASSKSALNGLGKQVINDHVTRCIADAVETKNTDAIEKFQKAILKFI